ncbi:TetR-like C-terminal domain-containing protein [Streptomyces sp. NBC_00390]|uniref:TetR-like C-terminal domain-containing protein n=1 Tax=Streptomyces sp. NBC_00390 TaxID=2975736 RepID=UPI002E225D96
MASDLPPAAVALALRIWSHLHGLVPLEIYGHLRTQTISPDKLFREELAQLIRSLNIAPQGRRPHAHGRLRAESDMALRVLVPGRGRRVAGPGTRLRPWAGGSGRPCYRRSCCRRSLLTPGAWRRGVRSASGRRPAGALRCATSGTYRRRE